LATTREVILKPRKSCTIRESGSSLQPHINISTTSHAGRCKVEGGECVPAESVLTNMWWALLGREEAAARRADETDGGCAESRLPPCHACPRGYAIAASPPTPTPTPSAQSHQPGSHGGRSFTHSSPVWRCGSKSSKWLPSRQLKWPVVEYCSPDAFLARASNRPSTGTSLALLVLFKTHSTDVARDGMSR
jgi:hypothetical protein